MPSPTYTRADLGCWIDGAFGTDHAVDKLRAMLLECDGPCKVSYRGFCGEVSREFATRERAEQWARQVGKHSDSTFAGGLSAEHRAMAEEAVDSEIMGAWEPSEWLNDATEALYSYTAPGLAWIWDAGDLILTDESEDA